MDDEFWKQVGEAIDAQVKELAERQAINTAKYLNESYAAVRKEMNNETLIKRMKIAAGCYFGEISPLFREAVAEIERLEKLMEQNNSKHMEVLRSFQKERNSGLRDQFAIAALEGTLSAKGWHPEYIIPSGSGHVGGQRAADAAAESAYKYADAMMKAREK